MLLGNFFTIATIEQEDGRAKAILELNPSHSIFNGHFPGQPVVPGVCTMQMIVETLEKILDKRLQVKSADHMKFLSFIDPRINPALTLDVSYFQEQSQLNLTARLFHGDTVFLKMKAQLLTS